MGCHIVFIGAGNLATHLSLEFKKSNYSICQVYSRTKASAKELAGKLKTDYTTDPGHITSEADIYFIALRDDVYDDVLPYINFRNNLIVHCSGSMPLSVLSKYSLNTGVFYPLQTFSRNRDIKFREIPVFIEADSKKNEEKLLNLAAGISDKVSLFDSEKRLFLHISAVFACNFVNYLYSAASDIIKSKDIPFETLLPLIKETAMKVHEIEPDKAQTGPAVRFDGNTIRKHLNVLQEFPDYQKLYEIISGYIYKYHNIRGDVL
jgi:predicted short-subunit dehydrogenase-like oxidoreductase (DUF2520 family)